MQLLSELGSTDQSVLPGVYAPRLRTQSLSLNPCGFQLANETQRGFTYHKRWYLIAQMQARSLYTLNLR